MAGNNSSVPLKTARFPGEGGHSWTLSLNQLPGLIAELQNQLDSYEEDPDLEVQLVLSFVHPGLVKDEDDGTTNNVPLLTLHDAEYPEEGVYPINPLDCHAGVTIPPQAVEAQAAPAAVAVPNTCRDTFRFGGWCEKHICPKPCQQCAALAATPALPATEDSSAGDLAEEKIADEMTREERMIVLQRDSDGTPTVWCDPEIADIVCALNSGGIKTVASCSGHGVKPGGVALADGRQLLLLESLEAFNSAMSAITQAEVQAEPVALQMCSELRPRTESEKAAYLAGVADGRMYAERDADTAPQAQPADALDADQPEPADLWYLQDTRGYVGNDVLWWAKDGNGYTTDISKAHAYTRDEAFQQAAMRGTDRAWPKAYIDGKTRPAVDMQYIDHQAAMAAAQEGGKA